MGSYPSVHYGNFGDEKTSSSTKINGLPLGIKMIFPDGREFRHSRIGATAAVAGRFYITATAQVAVADTLYAGNLPLSATVAVGATSIAMSAGGTTGVATDAFADGYLSVGSSTGTGIGYVYKIKSNNSVAAGSTLSFTVGLYETDPVLVALAGATTRVGCVENEYRAVTQNIAGSLDVRNAGVACNSAAASSYVWLQTKGPAPVMVGASTLRGQGFVCASSSVVGAVEPIAAGSAAPINQLKQSWNMVGPGYLNSSAGTGGFAIIDLQLD